MFRRVGARHFAHDPSGRHHQDPIGKANQLRQLRGNDQKRDAVGGQFRNQTIDFGLCADIDAARRLIQDQHARGPRKPSSEHHLLLIASREVGDELVEARRLHAHAFDLFVRDEQFGGATEETKTRNAIGHTKRDILGDAAHQQQRLTLALFGRKADAGGDRVRGAAQPDLGAVDHHRARRQSILTENCERQLRSAGAHQSAEPHHLAGADHDADVAHTSRRQTPGLQRDLAKRSWRAIKQGGYGTADHEMDDVGLRQFRDRPAGDQTAIAQNGHAVGERAYLRHTVRNVDESHAFTSQLPDHAEEQLRFVVRQGRRRFVERQDAYAGPESAHDLEQLPMRSA